MAKFHIEVDELIGLSLKILSILRARATAKEA